MSSIYDDRDLPAEETAIRVTVTRDDLDTGRSEGTVIVLTGTDEQGRRVTFAGDSRSTRSWSSGS